MMRSPKRFCSPSASITVAESLGGAATLKSATLGRVKPRSAMRRRARSMRAFDLVRRASGPRLSQATSWAIQRSRLC